MTVLDEARDLLKPGAPVVVSNPEWRRIVAGLVEMIEGLERQKRRLDDMLPLFQEARDALPAITLLAAERRSIRLDLADRMDTVGVPDLWDAMDRARQEVKS